MARITTNMKVSEMEYPQTAEAYSAKMIAQEQSSRQGRSGALAGAIGYHQDTAEGSQLGGDAGHISRSVNGLQQVSLTMEKILSVFEATLDRLVGGHPSPQPTQAPPHAGASAPTGRCLCDVEALDTIMKQLFSDADRLSGLVNLLREL